ncbi:hypothetical protein PsW64_05205 [Pseudovibrio sp. W64]|uniref:hypothetical protein n=1 Tax=Pseudovibrio sp. W64 TaxID=1735583 RepID=UPI0007AEAD10|nr:hypothetical protein [Pseudovibrio sp. W64]KZK76476.1 hypothetical protein PsW64_05205 [Pseudovibrio sp. W64]
MNFLTKEIVWRDFVTFGLGSTTEHEPVKAEIRAYLGQLEIGSTLGAVIVKTKAELDNITNKPDYTPAIVGADSNHALSGYYQWLGGTWNYVRDLADSITRLVDIDGTGNAIRAKLRLGVSLSAVEFAVFVPIANNSGAVTIKVDDVLLPIRNGLGNELDPDDLQAGYPAMLTVIEGQVGYVLLNPANVEAVVLAAKTAAIAARNQAQTAQGKAEDALNQLEAAVEQASDLAFKRFNKLYLGSFDDDPDTDNEGNELADGALYFKSQDKKLKVYSDVDGWVLATPDTSDFLHKTNNLSDIPSAPHARQNLGLQNLAVLDKVGTEEIEDSSLSTQKYKNSSVTDLKLNSAKLNTLAGVPRIIAAAKVDGSGDVLWASNLTCSRTSVGGYEYEFVQALPSSKAGKYIVLTTADESGHIPRTTAKTKDGFKTGFVTRRTTTPYPFVGSSTGHDVVVIGVW